MKHENRIIKLTQKNYKIIQHHTTKKIFNKIIKQKNKNNNKNYTLRKIIKHRKINKT